MIDQAVRHPGKPRGCQEIGRTKIRGCTGACVLRDAPCRALLSMRDVVDGMKKFLILRYLAERGLEGGTALVQ